MDTPTPPTTTVSILDKDYVVSCPDDKRPKLHDAARYLNEQMKAIRSGGKVIGVERIAIMAALNISYELIESQNRNTTEEIGSKQQIQKILDRLDRAIVSIGQ